MRPDTLRAIAKRNDYALPDDLESSYEFRDFAHFLEAFVLTTGALQHYEDFRDLVVAYAGEAKDHGAVYIEAIFAPRILHGLDTDEVFSGYCDGAQEARELHGVEVLLAPDITRSAPVENAFRLVEVAARYRDRGIVAVGLGGEEGRFPNAPFEPAFRAAREAGLGSVPHAGEVVGPESVRTALDLLEPDRIRHGFRAIEDPALVQELADRGIVLDVTPISNVRTGAVHSLEDYPLPQLVAAGVRCSVSTDDPVMFDTDLTREYAAAEAMGLDPRRLYETALAGALCDEETRARLAAVAWESPVT